MADYGIKIAKENKSVKGNELDLAADTALDSLKVDLRKSPSHYGQYRLTFNADPPLSGTDFTYQDTHLFDIPHNLGYIPAHIVTGQVEVGIPSSSPPSGIGYLPNNLLNTSEYTFFCIPDENKIAVWVERYQSPGNNFTIIGAIFLFRYNIFSRELQ